MASRLTIWSGAFAGMAGGGFRTSALDEQGNPTDRQARAIAGVYPTLVVDCLLIEIWPWTLRRYELNRQDAPSHPYAYRFTPPATAVEQPGESPPAERIIGSGPIALYDDASDRETMTAPWEPEGLAVYTDAETLYGTYQYRAPEEAWPEQFAEYVRLRIMAETAGAYMGDPAAPDRFHRRAEQKLQQVVDSVNQVLPQQVLFERFQTTSGRYGRSFRPIEAIDDGRSA